MRLFLLVSSAMLLASPVDLPAMASPLDATSPVPPLTYRSPFSEYRAFDEVEPKSWRQVNDTVREVGGHAGTLSNASRGGRGAGHPGASHGSSSPAQPKPSPAPKQPERALKP